MPTLRGNVQNAIRKFALKPFPVFSRKLCLASEQFSYLRFFGSWEFDQLIEVSFDKLIIIMKSDTSDEKARFIGVEG